jgi:hypothetical protein
MMGSKETQLSNIGRTQSLKERPTSSNATLRQLSGASLWLSLQTSNLRRGVMDHRAAIIRPITIRSRASRVKHSTRPRCKAKSRAKASIEEVKGLVLTPLAQIGSLDPKVSRVLAAVTKCKTSMRSTMTSSRD